MLHLYLPLLVTAGLFACFQGYRRLPVPLYRVVLLLTVVASGLLFSQRLGPAGWIQALLAVVGVVALMAWSRRGDSVDLPCGFPELKRAACDLWRCRQ